MPCSPGTCCSPAPSAAPTCPAATTQTILKSLARTLTLPDETVVLPGHGPQTTIGDERQTNPFLTGLQPAQKGL